jgi:hypothetical protein
MFAFTYGDEQGHWLEKLDPETGELTPLWDLNHLNVGIIGSSFDSRGTLWFLGRGGSILSHVPLGFFKMEDLATGEVVETFFEVYFFGEPEAGMSNLALPQWRKVLSAIR